MRRQCRLLRFLWALAAPYSLAYVAVEARVPVAPDSVKLLEASHRGSGLVAAAAPPRGAAAKQELSPPSRRLTTSGFTVIGTQSSASGSLPNVTEGAFLLPGASVTVYEDSQSLEHTISIEADVAGAGSLSASSVEALFDKYSVRSLIEQALFDGLTTRCKVAMMGVTATQSSEASPSTWSLAITYLGTVVAPTASACFILEGLANEMADLCTSGSTAMQTFRDNFETGMASVAATDGTSLSFVLEGFSSGVGISCGTSEPSYSGVTTEVLDAAVGSLDCFPIFPSIDNWVPPSDCPNEHGTSCAFQCASGYSLWCFGDVTLDPVPRSACYDGFPSVEAACGQIECHAAEHYVLAGECRPDCGAAPSLSMVWDGTENVDNDSLALCAGRSHGALCELVCVYGFHSQDRDGNKPGTFMCVDGAYEGELACIGSTCEGLSPNLLYDAASDEMVDAGTSDTGHELASMTDCTDMPFLGQCSIYCQAGLTQICEEDYARIEINGVSYGQPSDGNANCETIKCSQGDVVVPRHRCLAPCTVPPLNIAFSTTDFSQTCTYGEHGTTCSFECQTGYHPSGLVVCVEGSFLNDQTCLPDDCVGAPITGSNYLSGSSSPCWNLEHGGECYVSCDSGYTIACGTPNDDPQIHDALTCARVTCSLGQFVIHGTHWCAAKCYIEPTFFDRVMPAYPYSNGWYPCQPAVHGYVCSFGCVEGASPAGELVCNDGYFVGGSCNEDGCTGVPALTFDRTRGDPWMYPGWGANMDTSAMSDCENMGSNTSCEISCVAGSTLYCEDTSDPAAGVVNPVVDDISCDIIHCRRGVRYIPNVRCVEDCTGLPVTEFAVAETVAACDPMWHNYEPCEWECIEGADPEEPILCWEGDYTVTPTCIPRNCSGFPDLQSAQTPVNAWQSTFAYDYDAMADCIDLVHTGSCEIACAPGYSFTCGSDGLGDPASCLTIGCYLEVIDVPQHKCVENCWYSQIADIAHATLESLLACNDTVHTGTCPMECVDGWHNEGKGVFTCTLSFFEEDSFPYCEEDPCLDSPEPLGLFPTYASGHTCFDSGTVHCNADRCARGIDHGETCIPVCNEGYYLVGNLGCSFGNYTAENGLDCLPYDGCGPLPILGKYMRTIDLVRGTLTHLEPPEENHLARYSVTCALPRWELPGKDLEPQIYECHDGAWEVLLPGGPDGWPGGDWVPHADAALLECQELPCVPRAVPDDGEGRYICNDSLTDEGNYPHYSVCFLDCAAEGYVADPPHVMYQCSYMDVYTASSMNLGLGVLGTVPTSGTLYYDYYLPDLAPAATQAFFSPRAIRDMLDGNGSVYVFDNIEASCALLTCDLPEFYAGDIPVVLDGDTRDVSSGSPSMLKLVCIGTSYQSTCSPECRDGFEPMGNLECNSLGVFEGRPICKRTAAECRDLPQLPDSLVDVATLSSDCAGLDTGGRCEVTCNEGYTASGSGTWYYECASGAFSSSPVSSGGDSNMVCTVNPCTELPSSLLLASDMSHCTLPASYGSTCDVKCEPGYRPSVDTITCGSVQAGSWYIPPQVCVLEENYKEGTGDFEDSTVVAISLTLTSNPQEEELSYRALALETIKTEKVATPGISAHEMVLVVAAALDAVAAVPPRHEILALLVGAVENGLSLQEQANYTIAALQFLLTEPDEADAATTGSDYAQVVLNDGADAGQSAQALARALLASDLSLSSWLALGAVVDAASGLVQVQLRGASAGGSRRLTLGGEALGEGGSPALGELAGSLFASLRQVSRADLGLATWEPSSRDRALAAERTRRGCLAAGDAAWEAEVAAAYAAARLAGIALANLSAARAAADFLSAVQEAVAEPSSAVADAGARASQIDAVAAALCAHLPGADGAAGAGAEAAYAVCVEAGLARAEAVQVAAACAFVACTGSSLECLASVGKTVGMLARVHRLGAAEAAEAAALAALGRGFNTTEQLALAAAAGARPFGLETAALTAAVIPASVEPGDARIAVGRVSTASIHDALVAALGELYMESPLSVSCGITAALAAKAADVLVEPSRIALAVQQVLVLEEMSVSYSQQYIDQCALTAAGLVRGLAGQQDFSFVAAKAPLFAPSSATREDFGTTVNSLVVDQGMTEIARCVATYPTALAHKYSHGDAAIISALAYGITKDEIEAFRSSYTDSPPKTIQEVMDEAALGVGTVSHAVKVAAVAKDEGLSFVEAALFALVDATTLEELQAGVTTERAVLILSRLALSTAPVASCFGGTASELVEALLALWYFQAEGGGSAGPDAVTLSAIVVILAAIAMHEETFDEAVEDMAWRAVKALPRRQGKDIDLLEARFRAAGAALAATAGVSAAAREIAASVSTGPTRDAADFAGVPFTPMGQNAFDWSSEHAAAVYDAVLYASGDAKVAGRAVAIVGESRGESASWAVATAGYLALLRQSGELAFFGGPVEATRAAANAALAELSERNITADSLAAARKGVAVVVDTALLVEAATAVSRMIPELIPFMSVPEAFETAYEQVTALATESRTPQAIAELVEGALAAAGATDMVHLAPWLAYVAARLGDLSEDAASEACVLAATRAGLDVADAVARAGLVRASLHLLTLRSVQEIAVITYELYGADSISQFEGSYAIARGYAAAVDAADLTGRQRVRWQLLQPYLAATATDQRVVRNETVALVGGGASGAALGQQLQPLLGAGWQATAGAVYFAVWEAAGAAEAVEASWAAAGAAGASAEQAAQAIAELVLATGALAEEAGELAASAAAASGSSLSMVAGVISELDQTSTLLSDRRVPWPPLNDSWLSEEVQAARRLTTTFDASWALSDAVFGIWPRAVAKVVGVDIMQVSIEGIRDVEAAARRLRSRGGGASEASLVDGVGRRLTSSFSAAITVDAAVAIYPVDDVELIKARAILLASEVSAEFNIFLTEVSEQLVKVGIDAEPFVRNLVLASSTPVELANIPILQANWAVVSEWTMCSNLCGWGVRFRTVECNINEYLCNANKPATFLDHVRVLEGELTYPLNDSFNDWEEGYVMPGQKIFLPTVAECQWYSECDFMIMCPFGPDLENGFEACEAQFTLASASYGGFAGAVVLFWCVYCCRKCRTPTGGRHRLYVAKGLRRRKQKLDVQWKRVKKGRGVVREVAKCEPGKSKRSKVRIVWDVDVHRVQQYMSKRRDSKAESEAGSESETSLASHILAERIYLSGEDGSFFVHCRLRTGNPEGFIFGKAFPAADPGDDPMCTAKVLIMREGLLVFQMGAEELVGVTRLNDVSWHEVGLMYIQEHNVYALVVDGEEEARGLQGMADHSATAWLIGRPVQQDLAMGTLRTELRNLGVDMLETEYQEHPFFDGDIDTFKWNELDYDADKDEFVWGPFDIRMPDLGRDDSSSSSESGSDDDRPLEFAHAYDFGENVEYFSKSHNKWVSARVTGNNYFNKSPLDIDRRFEAKFVCTIGRGVQERRDVPMALLRTIPSEAQPVSVFSGHGLKGKWFPASVHGLTTASQTTIGYTIKYDEGDLDGNESKVVAGVPAKHLRSRFPEFARVQVYRGPCLGWEDAVVVRQKQDEDGPARQPHEEEPTDSELESDSDGSARHERTETEPMPTGADRGSMTAGNPPAGASSDSDSDSDSDDAEAAEGAEDSDDAEGAEGGEGAEAAEGAAAGPEAPSTPISSAVADSPRDHTAPGGSRETALSPPRSPRGVVVRTEKRKQSQGGEIWKSKNADLHDIDRFMDPDMPRHRLVDSKALENSRHNRNKANNNKGPKNNKSSNSPHAHWVQVTICPYRPPPSAEGSGKHGSRKTQDKGGGVGGFSDDESASKMSSPRGGALPVGAAPALDQPVLNPEEEEDVPSYLLRFDEEYLRRLRLERDMREAELDDDGNENDPTRVLGIIRNMPSRELTGVSGSTRTPRSMLGPYPSPRSVASMASTRRSHISGTPRRVQTSPRRSTPRGT